MFHRTPLAASLVLAIGSGLLGTAAQAQTATDTQRVEVTGSSIKRLASETALPVTVISREQIEQSGAVNVEDVLRRVAAISGLVSDSTQGAGYATSNANMRSLGPNSTLVLLNGRRLAGHPFGSIGGSVAVDLNSIPFAALERIEVLRDGASAIYGTDAVAGVINFITRRDYDKGEISLRYGDTEAGVGGRETGVSVAYGLGNLGTDKFNLLVTGNVKKQTRIKAVDQGLYLRHATEVPGSLPPTSYRAFPGRLMDVGITPGAYDNPGANMAACDPVNSVVQDTGNLAPNGVDTIKRCRAIYAALVDNLPDSTKSDLFTRGTFALDSNTTLFAEASFARNHTIGRVAPTPISGDAMKVLPNGNYPNVLMPTSSRYFPLALLTRLGFTAADWDPDGDGFAEIATRSLDMGNRVNDNTNEQLRLVTGVSGLWNQWDYDVGLSVAQARGTLNYSGYLLQDPYLAALRSGNVNPFGPNDATGQQLLKDASLVGVVRKSKSTVIGVDAKMSREIGRLAGGAMSLALGTDVRQEKADDRPTNADYSAGAHIGGEGSVPRTSASRKAYALFSELAMPFMKEVELTAAARYDKYSDFGSSFNPALKLRIQPDRSWMVRASAGTGFRAPTLWDVNSPTSNTNTADVQVDPNCPAGHADDPRCETQFNVKLTSDPNLKPEKSRQFSVGVVLEPVRDISMALDYWSIRKSDQIGVISGDQLMSDPALYAKYAATRITRTTDGFISSISTPVENLGGLRTSGFDLDVRAGFGLGEYGKLGVSFAGTYISVWEQQNGKGSAYKSYVGVSTGGVQPIPRWQHTLGFDWSLGVWGATLENTFVKGWTESAAVVDANLGVAQPYNVNDTTRWNLAVSYKGFKNTRLGLGVRNLLDAEPPFVASSSYGSHSAGFAGSFADPRGRFWYLTASYQFK
ncbi:TonB-dependent receptor [Ideonella sp. 4Y16]|uniref:TonB-dependent receptor plug domain-containing protein n=1 Tax=Ideonella alba TaxID=2824118 RepID=UPI001B3984A9|nr:TonB-dependent receptor [Ideonella alba]MBQ0945729.1 TonB-dependent receptor [Ideonella alba]